MLLTAFAPSQRCSDTDLRRQIGYFADSDFVRTLLNAMPSVLLILNGCRQIVFANRALYALAGLSDGSDLLGRPVLDLLGRRPGEAMGCTRANETEAGCGTSQGCAECGAVLSILDGLDGRRAVNECRLTRARDGELEDLDLLVWSTPFSHNDERFTVCAFSDISSQKRRNVLEHIFFHDILNLAGGIKGFAELLVRKELDDPQEALALISAGARQIVDEIRSQQLLIAAENRELRIVRAPILLRDFLEEQMALYQAQALANGKTLALGPVAADEYLVSDSVLLGRVLGNMLKNALEATTAGQTVTLSCHCRAAEVEIRVHNPGVIPLGAQFQIFHRSFSSKGANRGLGTYSMRLLSQYLNGRVGFISNEREGTVFHAIYPRSVQ